MNLGTIFQEASIKVKGIGGGHDVAAGAQLPEEAGSKFLMLVDHQVGEILREKSS